MNSYVLAYKEAPIKHADVTLEGQKLIQKGTIQKGVDLPSEMEGTLSVTEEAATSRCMLTKSNRRTCP